MKINQISPSRHDLNQTVDTSTSKRNTSLPNTPYDIVVLKRINAENPNSIEKIHKKAPHIRTSMDLENLKINSSKINPIYKVAGQK